MTTLGEHAHRQRDPHAACSLTACLDPLHPGPCKGWKGNPEEAFDRVAGQSRKGIRAFNTVKGVKGAKASHRQALLSYVNGSGPINRSLRASGGKGSNDAKITAEIKAMDQAMAASKLTHPVTVQRAISPSAFGGKDTSVDLTGAEYTDHAFGSTGTDLRLILKHFHTTSSGKQPLIANITIPAGASAIRVPPGQWGDEKEVLLDRGMHFRVVKDHGFIDTPKGRFRHVSLEVVPGDKPRAQQVDLGNKNQTHRNTVTASADDDGCTFCMQTHKPGLCKGQKRGEAEPGYEDAQKKNPAQVAQAAVTGLTKAIAQAQAVAASNPTNPKLAAMARHAIAGYKRALGPHQQTLKDAARQNDQAKRTGAQDTRQQDNITRTAQRRQQTLKAQAERRAESKRQATERRAETITRTRAEQAKVAKMGPKQRAAYLKQRSATAKAQRTARENQTLKDAAAARKTKRAI